MNLSLMGELNHIHPMVLASTQWPSVSMCPITSPLNARWPIAKDPMLSLLEHIHHTVTQDMILLPVLSQKHVVYRISCNGCQGAHYGETGQGLAERIVEHKADLRHHRTSSLIHD